MPKTQQAEGGSPKVAERPWPKVLYARKKADWIINPRLSTYSGDAANEPDFEEETYIPISAPLSDETKEAARLGYLDALKRGAEPIEAALQAAIDHLGGIDAR